jgi:predicted membrane-bound dolichyl-phosphate-mannose-protein mannosyltransferase
MPTAAPAPRPALDRLSAARHVAGARRRARRLLQRPWAPLALVAAVVLLSLTARAAWLGQPCRDPCRSSADRSLVFDETYYVNAARVIAGLRPPAAAPYADAPSGTDPNSEHPQLAKLIIAGSIEALGDGPWAWRLGSLILGTLAILGMFALVRAAGGGQWLGLGAAALMAADNLLLVHGRIGTLDIYALAPMIWGVALYLRGRPLTAGALIGVGACCKEVAPYALLVLALLEGLTLLASRSSPLEIRRRARRLALCGVSAAGVFVGLLALLDRIAPPYTPQAHATITGGPFAHISRILNFAGGQVSPDGPRGIASYPWQWFGDYNPIVYLNINPGRGPGQTHPAVHFLGVISPPILLLALPALALAAWSAGRTASVIDLVALAWVLGTFVPFELLSLIWSRTSYLYYMVVVMPGIYIAVARLAQRRWTARWLVGIWVFAVLVAAVWMYPFTPV